MKTLSLKDVGAPQLTEKKADLREAWDTTRMIGADKDVGKPVSTLTLPNNRTVINAGLKAPGGIKPATIWWTEILVVVLCDRILEIGLNVYLVKSYR